MSPARAFSFIINKAHLLKPWIFPLCVVGLYGVGMLLMPKNTKHAMDISGDMFGQLALPMCSVIVMMMVVNRFLSPAMVTRFLGQKTGVKGVLLSSLAGVLSMGPVYAWYPLFTSLREKGVSIFIVANFICCRSVKPALFPVLIAYFGWHIASIFVLMSMVGALITSCVVCVACPADATPKDNVPGC